MSTEPTCDASLPKEILLHIFTFVVDNYMKSDDFKRYVPSFFSPQTFPQIFETKDQSRLTLAQLQVSINLQILVQRNFQHNSDTFDLRRILSSRMYAHNGGHGGEVRSFGASEHPDFN